MVPPLGVLNNWSQLKDSIRGGSRGWGSVSCVPLLFFLHKNCLEFLWVVGLGRDDLPFIQGLLPQNCWEQQPKAQRQMATWIWVKDEIVMFESQPGEAARAAQMFPLSSWQRRHQEGKGRGDRRLPGSTGERAEQLPSRGLYRRSPLATPAWNMPVDSR